MIELLEEELESCQQLVVVVEKVLKFTQTEDQNVDYVKLAKKLDKKFNSLNIELEKKDLRIKALTEQNEITLRATEVIKFHFFFFCQKLEWFKIILNL